ncbi:MarR family transcriptional regulator [Deinococcus sp. MIMF12]|uniref:MarR family transcriptional regulator n=1 Tax=Deinococcus rhizophilus TaxID=3049544 RepID=A0ABT7JEA1_9DEIO|nr:MarR family transcriptional regulator [Deinococcus rhizophilus]MDL2343387.1 MarR family transcriptional regulator [Deinococcus rhizophilus]
MAVSPPSPPSRPGPTPEQVSLFIGRMWHFNRKLKQDVNPLLAEKHDLDTRRFFVLRGIQQGAGYPKVLAERLELPPALLSRYLDGLARQGLIARALDPDDSRRTRLSLTPQGEAALAATVQTVHELVGTRLSRLAPDTMATVLGALAVLTDEGQTQENPA